MRKFVLTLLIAVVILTGTSFSAETVSSTSEVVNTYHPIPTSCIEVKQRNYISKPITSNEIIAEEVEPDEPLATEEEIELLALLVMAEAEGECEEGQRLVIDVVLNRVDDSHFPNTIQEVVYQKNQFSGMYGERITHCYVKDELVQLVREELKNRTNYDVIFFRTQHYHSYGVPMFQVGAHYFSSYD